MDWILPSLFIMAFPLLGQSSAQLRIIAFGAHPDDCDLKAGGLAAKYVAAGHKVKFVSVTNGDVGHHEQSGGILAKRRRAEAEEAGRRIGVEYEVLDNHDGELLPTLEVRRQIIQRIRQWQADIVLSPRPNDYHPDHRYTGVLVQDAAFMVTVPNLETKTPALRRNPVFLYYSDNFQRPQPFRADIVVALDDVIEKKIEMLDAHVSQFYEWLPWHSGELDKVPKEPVQRKKWLGTQRTNRPLPEWKAALEKWYGAKAASVEYAEAFEITEYGRQPDDAEIRRLFPFFP
jgi:LmbE family N-acetylglucosaminyl deacetylase